MCDLCMIFNVSQPINFRNDFTVTSSSIISEVMSTKKFEFEFEDESAKNGITIEYDDSIDDLLLNVSFDYGQAIISANPEGFMVLAKMFLKLALGNYCEGFHVHLGNNFDADGDDVLTIGVIK